MEILTPEEKLIRDAQKGDLDAFESLVKQHQSIVITTAFHLVGDQMEADDVAQEVWIRVFRSLPRFQFKSRFSTWLYRITVNQALSALKRRKWRFGSRKQDISIDEVGEIYPLRSKRPGPRSVLEGKEIIREFRRALDDLPRRQRMAVVLVLLQGLSHREAGKIMGVAEKTVSWHLFKARERLMDELEDVM